MKALIVEDDFTSRLLLYEILKNYGNTQTAVNGKEAVEAVSAALDADDPFDLVCMDIMMPEMDGQQALKKIRRIEQEKGISSSAGAKIIMVTALSDMKNMFSAYHSLCDGYLVKPIQKEKLLEELQNMHLIDSAKS